MLENYPEILAVKNQPELQAEVQRLKDEKPDPFWAKPLSYYREELEKTLGTFNWFNKNNKNKNEQV